MERTASNTPGARRDAGVNNLRKGASASAIKPRSVERENTVSTTPGVGRRTSMVCADKTRKVPSSGGLVQGSFEKTVNDGNIGIGLALLSAGVETTSPTAAIGRRAEQDDSAGVQDAPAVDHVTVAPHVRNGKVDTVNRDHRSGKGDSSGENGEMGKCCSCNAKGICSKCRCATNHTFCVNCAPGGRQRCQNGGNRAPFRTAGRSNDLTPVLQMPAQVSQSSSTVSTLLQESSNGNPASGSKTTDSYIASDCILENVYHQQIIVTYEKVVKWRRNLFNVPFGSSGGSFVDELASIIVNFADPEPRPSRKITWKAVGVACHLLLQRPTGIGSASTFSHHLERRLALWRARRIADLVEEAECIQNHLPNKFGASKGQTDVGLSDTTFSKLVFDGKIKSAVRYLSRDSSGVLHMEDKPVTGSDKTVLDYLLEKHPSAQSPPPEALLDSEPLHVNPILFESITPDLIKNVARVSKGSAGPSGLDADGWKRMLTCFKQASHRLCTALSSAAYCLCTQDRTEEDLSAFTAARLIPLDKKPGVRPIAVGEVYRRIICKAIMRVVELDVLQVTAPVQLCVGVPSASEAAVHSMDRLFWDPAVEGLLLVDASNAFNSLNRSAALHNIPRICPALAKIFTNTYCSPIRLFVSGGGEVSSCEGTCQGDPLAMAIYAVAITPLIHKLQNSCPSTTQCWYADDDCAGDKIRILRHYWDKLIQFGPGYGYYPNAEKTVLLAKEEHKLVAQELFADTGVEIGTSGCRYLGGSIGSQDFCTEFVQCLVDRWCNELRTLATLAKTQPHAAYTVFLKGIASKWRYHIRSTNSPPDAFKSLDDVINLNLLPALTGRQFTCDSAERQLLTLPVRLGGLAVPVMSAIISHERAASRRVTKPLVDLIVAEKNQAFTTSNSLLSASCFADPLLSAVASCRRLTKEERITRYKYHIEEASSLAPHVSTHQRRLLSIASQKGVSSWLTADPTFANGTVLNKADFRDALCLRLGYPLDGLPPTCVCGQAMVPDHAFTCPCGGYPIARHNQVRDCVADIARSVFSEVEIEPVLLPFENEDLPYRTANRSAEARVDVKVHGFWARQQEAFFDIRVTHPKAQLLTATDISAQLVNNEREKKRQYNQRIINIDRGVFTPLIFSTTGMIGGECQLFLKTLANQIAQRNKDIPYSIIMNTIRCKLSFCILRWNITCLRGSRSSYQERKKVNFLAECRLQAPR